MADLEHTPHLCSHFITWQCVAQMGTKNWEKILALSMMEVIKYSQSSTVGCQLPDRMVPCWRVNICLWDWSFSCGHSYSFLEIRSPFTESIHNLHSYYHGQFVYPLARTRMTGNEICHLAHNIIKHLLYRGSLLVSKHMRDKWFHTVCVLREVYQYNFTV
jgi:hypothetical protein